MVEELFGKDEINKAVEDAQTHGAVVKLALTAKEIQEWKENGNFKHIRNELTILPKLKYSCTTDGDSCHYYFICENEHIRNRISRMLESLAFKNTKIRIVDTSKNTQRVQYGLSEFKVLGEPKYCNLFS